MIITTLSSITARFLNQMASHVPHVSRTSKNFRYNVVSDATVTEVHSLSSAVKGLKLKVTHPEFSFKPGQWVDFFIPNVEEVGGFSIVSTPSELRKTAEIYLAVKNSKWAPAHWIHNECKVGSDVQLRVGGDFFFDPNLQQKLDNILLIAGGVGINPLISIAKHLSEIRERNPDNFPSRVTLLYSSRTTKDLLFQEEIRSIAAGVKEFKFQYFVTRHESNGIPNGTHDQEDERLPIKGYRITAADLEEVLNASSNKVTDCYLCGPPPMIDNIVEILASLNVARKNIHYEKWW